MGFCSSSTGTSRTFRLEICCYWEWGMPNPRLPWYASCDILMPLCKTRCLHKIEFIKSSHFIMRAKFNLIWCSTLEFHNIDFKDSLSLEQILCNYMFLIHFSDSGNYLKFYQAIKHYYPEIKIISNCDGSSQKLDHPADLYDYHVRFYYNYQLQKYISL